MSGRISILLSEYGGLVLTKPEQKVLAQNLK